MSSSKHLQGCTVTKKVEEHWRRQHTGLSGSYVVKVNTEEL